MTQIVRRKGDWLSAEVGGEVVMMRVEIGNYVGMNEVGARIWQLIETPCSIDALCATLVAEFDVSPHECLADTTAFLDEMVKQGAVSLDEAEG